MRLAVCLAAVVAMVIGLIVWLDRGDKLAERRRSILRRLQD